MDQTSKSSSHESPDQNQAQPKSSDVGGHHLAFYVDDLDAAVACHLAGKGVRLLGKPTVRTTGPNAGQQWIYFLSPWGMQFELVSFPHGKGYEKETDLRLWHPADPAGLTGRDFKDCRKASSGPYESREYGIRAPIEVPGLHANNLRWANSEAGQQELGQRIQPARLLASRAFGGVLALAVTPFSSTSFSVPRVRRRLSPRGNSVLVRSAPRSRLTA